jgi:hypothetical protein
LCNSVTLGADAQRALTLLPARLRRAQLHHIIRNCPEVVNQRDDRGFTALHRAAHLAHHDGYLEIYEYLLVSLRAVAFVLVHPCHRTLAH